MIVTVVGARPQFIKAAVVSSALKKAGIEEKVVHTGQHYDETMSSVFWKELQLPSIFANLEVGSGSHAVQTARIMEKVEEIIISQQPRAVMVYGDTNSTMAAALAASKFPGIRIIHIESGLRSFNRSMPEEINRVVTDHLSHLLFCSSDKGVAQLSAEGITSNVHDVGDVMHDCIKTFAPLAAKEGIIQELALTGDPFVLMTVHRPSNTDRPENLESILNAIGKIGWKTIWPVHPRNNATLSRYRLPENLLTIPPASYFQMLSLLQKCRLVITDSGGLQKEAYWMQKRCITVREETEWVETLDNHANTLTGPDYNKILSAFNSEELVSWNSSLYGNGNAAEKIAAIIKNIL